MDISGQLVLKDIRGKPFLDGARQQPKKHAASEFECLTSYSKKICGQLWKCLTSYSKNLRPASLNPISKSSARTVVDRKSGRPRVDQLFRKSFGRHLVDPWPAMAHPISKSAASEFECAELVHAFVWPAMAHPISKSSARIVVDQNSGRPIVDRFSPDNRSTIGRPMPSWAKIGRRLVQHDGAEQVDRLSTDFLVKLGRQLVDQNLG